MASKFIFVLVLAAFASQQQYVQAGHHIYQHAVPVVAHYGEVASPVHEHIEHYDPHPQYKFGYSVDDQHTGDHKSHVEERDGDVVHGEYSLVDPDGYKRIVRYTADPHHGFNAVVHREPLIAHVAPVALKTYAPVTHFAHVSALSHAAPVYHHH